MKRGISKKSMIKGTIAIFSLGLCMICPWIQASASETGADAVSVGNMIYEDRTGSVAIYTEDIVLLKGMLHGVHAETYDPASYGHVHQWEYTDITQNTHTERCSLCGSSAELTNTHTEASSEKCVIAYDGKDYPGYRYMCDCGFEWLRERYHTPVYSPIDDSFHAVNCALHGTAYCGGMGEIEEEHISMPHPTDESHHRAVCEYCEYEGPEQACVFDIEVSPDENDMTQMHRYCACGNCLTVTEELPTPPEETTDPGAEPIETPEMETENGTENPPTPEDEPENGTEKPSVPEDEPEDGMEKPSAPEDASESGTETPPPPIVETEEDAENSGDSPSPQEKEIENKGGNQ